MKRFLLLSLAVLGLLACAAPASAQYRGGVGPRFGRSVGSYGGFRAFNSFGYGYGFAPQFVYAQPAFVVAPQVVYAQPQVVVAPAYAPQVVAASAAVAAPAVEAYAVPPAGYFADPVYGPGFETAVYNGRTFYHYPHRHNGNGGHRPPAPAPAPAAAHRK